MKKILILLLTVVTTSIYASGFAVPEQGAKAISMGNAFSAVADDASALFYNPAGITQLKGMINFNLGGTLLIPKNKWKNGSESAETKDDYPIIPQFNFIFNAMPKLFLGFGISSPYAAKIEWPNNWKGSELIEMMSLQMVDLSPTIAYKVINGLSIALTYDLGIAAVELRRRIKLSSEDSMLIRMASNGETFAHGFRVSLLYKWKELRTSFVFKYGKTFNFKGNANFDVTNPIFNSSKPSDQTMKLKLTLPMEFIGGFSYQILPELLFSFETQYTMWSSYDELRFKFANDDFTDENGNKTNEVVSTKNWKDVLALKFGLEYRLLPELALRLGYSYDFNPVPDDTLDPSLPDSNRHVMNLGFGYKIKNIQLDISYTYVLFTERKSVNKDLLGTYNSHVNIISFTTGFTF